MGRRSKQSPIEDLFDIATMLPWWLSVILAISTYLIIHQYAIGGIAKGHGNLLLITLANIFQYLIPLPLMLGALVNLVRQKKPKFDRFKSNEKIISTETIRRDEQDLYTTWTDSDKEILESTGRVEKSQWSIELLHELEWKRFEEVVAELFRLKGYQAKTTRTGADGGIDILVFERNSNVPLSLVQCKAWNTYKVGVKPIRELLGVLTAAKAKHGIFITTSNYTDEAVIFAKQNNIVLLNGTDVLKEINALDDSAKNNLLNFATKGSYTTPTCPSCDIKMIVRQNKNDPNKEFWGCRSFPRCKQRFPIKAV